jgi:hypothetical protein
MRATKKVKMSDQMAKGWATLGTNGSYFFKSAGLQP